MSAPLAERPWLSIYLRLLAVLYAFGGLVHIGNIFGFGEVPWLESPLAWRISDVAYAVLDIAALIGLWRRQWWGVACFAVAAVSQLVLYLGFPHVFVLTERHQQALDGLVNTHVLTLFVLALFLLFPARNSDAR